MFYVADFGPGYSGLTTVGVTQLGLDGSVLVPRSSDVVLLGNGAYGVNLVPDMAASALCWDTGGASPVFAYEGLSTLSPTDLDAASAAVWGKVIELGYSTEDALRLMASVLLGKVSGAGTGTECFRDLNDTKDRVVATVDASGNRLGVVRDPS